MVTGDLKKRIRNVPDFPTKGIQFKDITTLLSDPASFQQVIDLMAHRHFAKGIEAVVGIEARGFVMGAALAYKLEIHEDSIRPGMKVLVADDVLATGGTVSAVLGLLKKMGADVVECCFLAELTSLRGRELLKGEKIFSLLQFDD
jgi:adenine phosphoribosyltransferase